ncbi:MULTISPECIES: hypothetical protein [unclassified Haematobacter]|uniref:hypothetical protein n=1 Tax=unclassified Haematobacter TaxID=2640585 RepID=UPI0025B8924C|nr:MULTISPECIES: hypothetical protein [unclassified Haematobacter]
MTHEDHERLLRELETGKIEYDSHSDDICLAPGVPLTEAHIRIVAQRPYLADSWPQHLRISIGLPPIPVAELHPDDLAADPIATAMKIRRAK